MNRRQSQTKAQNQFTQPPPKQQPKKEQDGVNTESLSDFEFVNHMYKSVRRGQVDNFAELFQTDRSLRLYFAWVTSSVHRVNDALEVLNLANDIQEDRIQKGVVADLRTVNVCATFFDRWLAYIADNMTKEDVLTHIRPLWEVDVYLLNILFYSKQGLNAMLALTEERPSLLKRDVKFLEALCDRKKGTTKCILTLRAYHYHPPRSTFQEKPTSSQTSSSSLFSVPD